MTSKIAVYSPERKDHSLESLSARVMVITDPEKLEGLVGQQKADLVLMIDAPISLRQQVMFAAKRAGGPAVICINAPDAPAEIEVPDPIDQLELGRRHMDDNFQLPLTLAEIAAKAGISAGYFCRRFKRRYQLTPIEYLRNIRIARATHLLLNTDLALAAITEQSGFFSVSYFCREFHKAKGLAPITFRRQHSTRKIL